MCSLEVDQEGTVAKAQTAATGVCSASVQSKKLTFGCTYYMLIEYHKTLLFAAKIDSPSPATEDYSYNPEPDSTFQDSTEEEAPSDYDLENC